MSSIDNSYSSPELALLALYVEAGATMSAAHHEAEQNARSEQRAAMADELEALEDKADATRWGAWTQGLLSAGSGACSFSGEFASSKVTEKRWDTSARLLSDLAKPVSDLVGTARVEDAERDAKAAAQAEEQASWRRDDASEAESKLETFTDRLIEQVDQILETEDQGTLAVLANF